MNQECKLRVNMMYSLTSAAVSFWIPGLVMIVMYLRIYKEAIRQREALSTASSNTVLNNVHLHRVSGSRNHSKASNQLLLQPSEAGESRRPSFKSATELNAENGKRKASKFEEITFKKIN